MEITKFLVILIQLYDGQRTVNMNITNTMNECFVQSRKKGWNLDVKTVISHIFETIKHNLKVNCCHIEREIKLLNTNVTAKRSKNLTQKVSPTSLCRCRCIITTVSCI